MNPHWLGTPAANQLAPALFEFLWEGAAIAAIPALALPVLKSSRARSAAERRLREPMTTSPEFATGLAQPPNGRTLCSAAARRRAIAPKGFSTIFFRRSSKDLADNPCGIPVNKPTLC